MTRFPISLSLSLFLYWICANESRRNRIRSNFFDRLEISGNVKLIWSKIKNMLRLWKDTFNKGSGDKLRYIDMGRADAFVLLLCGSTGSLCRMARTVVRIMCIKLDTKFIFECIKNNCFITDQSRVFDNWEIFTEYRIRNSHDAIIYRSFFTFHIVPSDKNRMYEK